MRIATRSLLTVAALIATSAFAQVSVLTQHNDNQRTGSNPNETLLRVNNVNPRKFGKLFSREVDGQIYAQPLVVSGVEIPNKGVRNVVYVATLHNTVYAFDADDSSAKDPLWVRSLGTSVPVPNPYFGNRYGPFGDVKKEIGILSTPAIDRTTNTLYTVAFTQNAEGGPYHQRLWSLDLATGQSKRKAIEITAEVVGSGDGSVDGKIKFDPMQHMQRPGLLISNGKLWIAFAAHADTDPYHGWVFVYDLNNLPKRVVFCTSPNGGESGIWMAGKGMTADEDGNVYCMVGNGSFDGISNYGDSFLKFNRDGKLVDFFAPFNQQWLADVDADLGSAGVIAIPGTKLVVGGGKEGKFYVLGTGNMGKFRQQDDSRAVQSFFGAGGIFSSPVFHKSPLGSYMYIQGSGDKLKAYRLIGGVFDTVPMMGETAVHWPGAGLSVTSNGQKLGTTIVWAYSWADDWTTGVLTAYDAATLKAIYSSETKPERDRVGNYTKFSVPTVANGKVYVPTDSNALVVFGLFPVR